ncbi:MAG: MBL fold metallo-hydrolase [Planctomycetes bacterium]|nr:MBL fold metallo-hydrolase [Planctomycetota bacterium]
MPPFEAVVLGIGDAFTESHFNTAFVLRSSGATLAIDCPDRYRAVLKAASGKCSTPLRVEEIDDLLLTHLHGDHVNGLEALGFLKALVLKKRLRLWTTPEVAADLWDRRLSAAMSRLWDGAAFRECRLEDFFDLRVLDWNRENAIGPFAVSLRRTIHHLPTCALRVRAEGRTWGYSCDTAFDQGLIEWLSSADLIHHETNHGPAHTPYAALAALPAALRAKMRLVHIPDGLDEAASVIEVAAESAAVRVGGA